MGESHVQTALISVAGSSSATRHVVDPTRPKMILEEFTEGWV